MPLRSTCRLDPAETSCTTTGLLGLQNTLGLKTSDPSLGLKPTEQCGRGLALRPAWGRNGPWRLGHRGGEDAFPPMTFDLCPFPSFRLRGKGLAMLHVTRGGLGIQGPNMAPVARAPRAPPGPVIAGGQDGGVPQDVEPHRAPRLGPAVPRTFHPVLQRSAAPPPDTGTAHPGPRAWGLPLPAGLAAIQPFML